MVKQALVVVVLCMCISLAACGYLPTKVVKNTVEETTAEETAAKTEEASEEPEGTMGQEGEEDFMEEGEDDADIEEATFKSIASTVQMEITTGSTSEYLSYLCNFPITIKMGDIEDLASNEEDLEAIGLEALYTDELLKAVEECDIESLEIVEERLVLGNDKAYVVLERNEDGVIGITEMNCGK